MNPLRTFLAPERASKPFQVTLAMRLSQKKIQLCITPRDCCVHCQRCRSHGTRKPPKDVRAGLLDKVPDLQRANHRTALRIAVKFLRSRVQVRFHGPNAGMHGSQMHHRVRVVPFGGHGIVHQSSRAARPCGGRATRSLPKARPLNIPVRLTNDGMHRTVDEGHRRSLSHAKGIHLPLARFDMDALRRGLEMNLDQR